MFCSDEYLFCFFFASIYCNIVICWCKTVITTTEVTTLLLFRGTLAVPWFASGSVFVKLISPCGRSLWPDKAHLKHTQFPLICRWGCPLCKCWRPSFFLNAADPPRWVVSELSHDSLHISQTVCDSVSFKDSCARWDKLGEALRVDWTLALAQNATQQEQEQMAKNYVSPNLPAELVIYFQYVLFLFVSSAHSKCTQFKYYNAYSTTVHTYHCKISF